MLVAAMLLGRRAKSVSSKSTFCIFNLTGSVGSNPHQDFKRTLCYDFTVCFSRVNDRWTNNFFLATGKRVDTLVIRRSPMFSRCSGPETRLRSVRTASTASVPKLRCQNAILGFPRTSRRQSIIDRFAPGIYLSCGTTMSGPRFDTCRVISRAIHTDDDAVKQKQVRLTNKEDTEVQGSKAHDSGLAPESEKQSKRTQLKKVFKEYGAVGVTFHVGISLISLGIFYLAVSSGLDMAVILCKLGFSESVVQSKMAAGTSTFLLAYAIHKLFAPLRISITLVSVPLIVRHLRKTGLFRPPPNL